MFTQPVSLIDLAGDLRRGDINLADYVDRLCDRLEQVEPHLQTLLPEPERRARLNRDAAELQARYPDPARRPPLFGVPAGIKDIFHADGFLTRAGSALPPLELAGQQAAIVTRLKLAGALILGKTVTTEFAYFEPGPTGNPHNPAHTPGGSSSGSAAAVAAGLCPLATGTQTIGSIIRPAAYCGVVGFKPSYGRINPAGVIFVSRSLDHVGLFTQTVADMAFIAALVCDQWRAETQSAQKLPALGVPEGEYLKQAGAEGLAAFEAQVARLQQAGYTVQRVPALDDIETVTRHHLAIMSAEMAREHDCWFEPYRHLYRPRTLALLQQGQAVSPDDLAAARQFQQDLRPRLENLMAEKAIDLWLSPAAPGPAPAGLAVTGSPAMNLPWTQAGLPAITVPAGCAANGLPLGLQLAGRFMADEELLAWAAPIAAALKGE